MKLGVKSNKLHSRSSVLFFVPIIFILSFCVISSRPQVVYAHQSGCHRWHSCPSDSGSYVCGDTGYSNYCGSTTPQRQEYVTPSHPSSTSTHYVQPRSTNTAPTTNYEKQHAQVIPATQEEKTDGSVWGVLVLLGFGIWALIKFLLWASS